MQVTLNTRLGNKRLGRWSCWVTVVVALMSTAASMAQDVNLAVKIDQLVVEMSGQPLWPVFDPNVIPLAIYTGEETVLFRHPNPPAAFALSEGSAPEVWVHQGRHPAITANSSAEIGGDITATLLLPEEVSSDDVSRLAGIAVHEAFHVYQRQHHVGWTANEADLFLYPVDDPNLLALRRAETEFLRRALSATDSAKRMCWAAAAIGTRRERFSTMKNPFSEYERRTELNEGLATYVQHRANGDTGVRGFDQEFSSDQVRQRSYVIGSTIAHLLSGVDPAWRVSIEENDDQFLDQMLEASLSTLENQVEQCVLSEPEWSELVERAGVETRKLADQRRQRQAEFDRLTGWRVVIEANGEQPLWPQGFDPLNIERLENGLLHARFVRLGNDLGQLEMIDDEGADLIAHTTGLGEHPLFNGVGRVEIAGLAKPEIMIEGPRITVQVAGLKVDFVAAEIIEDDQELRIRLAVPQTLDP